LERAWEHTNSFCSSTRSPFRHDNPRQAFALNYKVDLSTLTLSISGTDKSIPIIYRDSAEEESADVSLDVTVQARVGDSDGANLPWFEYADSILLFWWIDKEIIDLPLSISWSVEEENMYSMDLKYAGRHVIDDPLLSIRMRGNDTSSFEVTVPARPLSSSPSWTYPIRVVILNIIAPIAIFVNDYLGDSIGFLFSTTFTAVEVLFIVLVYVFVLLTIVVSIYRCLGGPSLEDNVQRAHDCLEALKRNERLHFLHIETLQESLDRLYHNKRMQVVIGVCRNGWHPERDRERAAQQEEADIERASSSQEERSDIEKRGSSKDASAPML
jgi:hypothetical protein